MKEVRQRAIRRKEVATSRKHQSSKTNTEVAESDLKLKKKKWQKLCK